VVISIFPVSTDQPSIEVTNLTKHYGPVTAINEVSFSVAKGEIVGFLGPNGAGKSTTMRILSGLIPASSGIAKVCGIPVASHSAEIKRRIGYMAENNPLPEDMRVAEYLHYRASLKEIPAKQRKKRVEEVLETCDLHRKTKRKLIRALSKGFRQRVGIADSILANPEVAIMDEPTIGLDPHQILLIRDLINNLRGRCTLILSSHILAEVEICCDRVIIINQGRIVATGSPKDLRHEFIRRNQYHIRVAGEKAKLLEVLQQVDPEIDLQENLDETNDSFQTWNAYSVISGDLSEELIQRILRTNGLRLGGLTKLEPSLEDIFLSATRRSWDVTQQEAQNIQKTYQQQQENTD